MGEGIEFGGVGAATEGPVPEDPIFLPDEDIEFGSGAQELDAAPVVSEKPQEAVVPQPEPQPESESAAELEVEPEPETTTAGREYTVLRFSDDNTGLMPVGRVVALRQEEAAELAAGALGSDGVPLDGRYFVTPTSRCRVYRIAVETDPRVTVTAE